MPLAGNLHVPGKRIRGGSLLLVAGLIMAACLHHTAHADAANTTPVPATSRLGESEIEQAMSEVRADPNIGGERKQRMLRWKQKTQDNTEHKPPTWLQGWMDVLRWLTDLFQWIADSSRMLAWLLIATLVGLLVVLGLRIMRHFRDQTPRATDTALPTHVQHFDIRPESLPDDIGSSAWVLWQRNAHRDALALLYRGLLSRLVNEHGIPIRASSTEAECLSLCLPRLDTARLAYARSLLSLWQQAIYGARHIDDASIKRACDDFQLMNASLSATAAADSTAQAAS